MIMNIQIVKETEAQHHEVENVIREAFWNLYFPGCCEHYLAHVLRSSADFVPELSLVALHADKVIGSIMYTRSTLTSSEKTMEILTFGPVAVLPVNQRQGVGGLLIKESVIKARKMGCKAIVIFGDPHNYCRHGFKNGRDYNVSDQNGRYPYALLVLELEKGILAGSNWVYNYSEAYNVDPGEAEKYDSNFMPKEKGHRASQDVFGIAIRSYLD